MPRRPAFLLVLLLALPLLPLAAADHVFSHRVYVAGRVVDADGLPVVNVPVQTFFHGLVQLQGPCNDSPRGGEVTGPRGDYVVCRHAHGATENASVDVTVAGATVTAAIDPLLLRTAADVRVPQRDLPHDLSGLRTFNRTYHVEGRVMRVAAQPVDVEHVPVNATPRVGVNVTVRLVAPGALLAAANTTTNAMGDYAVDLDVQDVPEGALVRVEALGDQAQVNASPLRRADVFLVHDPTPAPPPATLTDTPRPGSETPKLAPGPAAPLVALGVALAAALQRRMRRTAT